MYSLKHKLYISQLTENQRDAGLNVGFVYSLYSFFATLLFVYSIESKRSHIKPYTAAMWLPPCFVSAVFKEHRFDRVADALKRIFLSVWTEKPANNRILSHKRGAKRHSVCKNCLQSAFLLYICPRLLTNVLRKTFIWRCERRLRCFVTHGPHAKSLVEGDGW